MHVRIGDGDNTIHVNLALTTHVVIQGGRDGTPGHITAHFAAQVPYVQGSLAPGEADKAREFLNSKRSVATA